MRRVDCTDTVCPYTSLTVSVARLAEVEVGFREVEVGFSAVVRFRVLVLVWPGLGY